jgi:8-oxo-dGTP pyrophosphatase MutT (NUDIX family)
LPALINGCADGYLIEACAGLLDGSDPETCIRREAEEETGYLIRTGLIQDGKTVMLLQHVALSQVTDCAGNGMSA